MEHPPLSGLTIRGTSAAPAAETAAYLLGTLGARVEEGVAGERADLSDGGGPASATGGVVLSPYGPLGRFAGGPADDAAVSAVGGALMAQWTYSAGPAYLVTPYATTGQALLAAVALLAQQVGGSGPSLQISGLHGLFAIQTGAYAYGPNQDPHRWTHTPRGQMPTYATYRAADDWLFLGASTMPFLIKVLQSTGLEAELADPRIHAGVRSFRGTDLEQRLWQGIATAIGSGSRAAWLAVFEAASIPAGPVLTLEEALAHPQMEAAGLVDPEHRYSPPPRPVEVLPLARGMAARWQGHPGASAPDPRYPLRGLRVVELAGYIAGPYGGRLLADLGADVVKIEPPDGDPFRFLGFGFVAWNHGKKSLALNLREAGARDRLLALVRDADVLLTNYRPEAMTRMGLGREQLLAVNPTLIHCTVSAFGETGPLAHLPGFDPVVQAFAGLQKVQGGAGEPVKSQIAATDYLAGMLAAAGVLAALLAQRERGGGAIVRTSLLAAAAMLTLPARAALAAGRPYPTGGPDYKGLHPLHGLHETANGWLLTALPLEAGSMSHGAHATTAATANATAPPRFAVTPPPAASPGGAAASASQADDAERAVRYLHDGVRHDSTDAALVRLAGWGVPAVPCLDPDQLPSEPHFAENRLWLRVTQPELGVLTFPAPALAPDAGDRPAPAAGEHNDVAQIW